MEPNVKCKTCRHLINGWCEKVIDSPCPDLPRTCQHFEQKTNQDKIQAMNTEELASFLDEVVYGNHPWEETFIKTFCDTCPSETVRIEGYKTPLILHECEYADGRCTHGGPIQWWLKQPAEEE